MLTSLQLKNFIFIENLELAFKSGMTSITGETGSGKSILMDAIQVGLGDKAQTDCIRPGADRAEIILQFDVTEHPLIQEWLIQEDLADNSECIIRRVLVREGKGRCYINQIPIPTYKLFEEFAAKLFHICGQHAHHRLLKNAEQRVFLDQFADHLTQVKIVQQLAHKCLKLKEQLTQWEQQASELSQKKDFIEFQLKDFEILNPQKNEFIQLEGEFKQLNSSEKHQLDVQQALELFSGSKNTSDTGILTQIYHMEKILEHQGSNSSSLKNALELIQQSKILLEEAENELKIAMEHLQSDPERLKCLEERLSALHHLARKHRVQPELLHEHYENLQEMFKNLDFSDERRKELESILQQSKSEFAQAANKLSHARREIAKKFESRMHEILQKLNMQNVKLQVKFSDIALEEFSPLGLEDFYFQVQTNPGQNFQPLAKIVSGGELSRISLALQTLLSQAQQGILIFDEVDVGIGGETADIVGRMLRHLAEKNQVLVITHLPQVAAKAHHHLGVKKHLQAEKVVAEIGYLTDEQRIEEVGRMLSGKNLTELTKAHAKELLEF